MKGNPKGVQTDPGCLDGVEKESAREEEYRDEIQTANLAQRMAVVTVQKYADRVGVLHGGQGRVAGHAGPSLASRSPESAGA